MKLSNQQIDALVDVVAEKENKKLKQAHSERQVKAKRDNSAKAKKYRSILTNLPEELKKIIKPYGGFPDEKEILNSLTRAECPWYDKNELRSKIIIASIDSDSMDELKRKLKIVL